MPTTDVNAARPTIALVTGASRGLGRSTVLSLAERGTDSIFTYHTNRAAADGVAAAAAALGRTAVALPLDAGAVATFPAFAVEVKRVLAESWHAESFDYLVNNAGTGVTAPFAETTQAQFDELLNVHFKGVFFLTQALLPLIADGGRIMNVSSGLTRFSFAGMSAYASMKGAIEVLTRYLAVELGSRRIAVNTFAPGAIATDFGGGRVRDDAAANAYFASITALGRVGQPEDIGPSIASLLSKENGWINAQRIEASGGTLV